MSLLYDHMQTPLGPLIIAGGEQGVRYIEFQQGKRPVTVGSDWRHEPDEFLQAKQQLHAYFQGELTEFTLPLDIEGTDFQKKVWRALLDIPYGTTISYQTLAKRVGNSKASRAVGTANGRNCLCIVIPCHRVIGSNGALTGYAGGVDIKRWLLCHEGAVETRLNPDINQHLLDFAE